MSLLYKGKYFQRFVPIVESIRGKSVLELCFGDLMVAEHCRKNGIQWKGLDINESFVNKAKSQGFDAVVSDIGKLKELPKADTIVIAGSLYHFHETVENFFSTLLQSSSYIVLSEPVINLSSSGGLIGKFAKRSATVKGQAQAFRYNRDSLLSTLNELSSKLGFTYQEIKQVDKDLILTISKN